MNIFENQKEKKKVAIYIRVSTVEQRIDGYGLEAQRTRLLEYIKNNRNFDYEIKDKWIFSDSHTGSDTNREGLKSLLKAVSDKEVDTVFVWKIDRLSRSLKHLLSIFEQLEANQVSFVSVQENIDFKGPIGKLTFQIFGAIAQFERELIKGRTLMGRIASAELGNYTGSYIPYGYKPVPNKGGKGKKLEIIPEEKKWIKEIFDWYIYDDLGYREIAKKLNELKVPKGKYTKTKDQLSPWTEKNIRKLIANTIYRGEHFANKKDDNGEMLPEDKWTVVSVPACVSELTFQQAHNARKNKKGGKPYTDYLLSGKLRDIDTPKPKSFSGCPRNKGGFSYRRQQFTFKETGEYFPVFEIPAKPLEEYVWKKVKLALKDPKDFIEFYLAKQYSDPSKVQRLENQLNTLREQKIKTEIAIARVELAFENGSFSEEKMNEKVSVKNKEISNTENKAQEIEDQLSFISSIDLEVEKLKEASKQVKYRLDNLSHREKKILVQLFVDTIEMSRVKEGKRWNISANIIFRFNPYKFPSRAIEGRTTKSLKKGKNSEKRPSKALSGAAGRN